jgi:anti-sigma B factor antagonist
LRLKIGTKREDASVRGGEATVLIDRSGPHPAVVATGLLTIDSSPRLRSIALGLIPKSKGLVLVIDLSGVTRIDLSGLATLLEVLNSAHEHSVRLCLCGITGQPRRLAEITQLDEIFRALGSEVEFR